MIKLTEDKLKEQSKQKGSNASTTTNINLVPVTTNTSPEKNEVVPLPTPKKKKNKEIVPLAPRQTPTPQTITSLITLRPKISSNTLSSQPTTTVSSKRSATATNML
ncbi:unnamed protein product [Rotaria sordida]|uniref:Uncharacterized protein n=1 Tax=Rotaria sordida TaxID=392033 RepID=A0A815HND1_9BILA|nr:unnamed protein product [Rotaria sordida]CAF4005954.1 unnamed protein product [Rotaria sordida]